jgi:YgiT-type zinc finger domain-containing protein
MMTCDDCRIGRMWSTRATYLYPVGEQVLVYAQAPALACDVCGNVEFDPLFADLMEALIMDTAEREDNRMLSQSLAWRQHGGYPRFRTM